MLAAVVAVYLHLLTRQEVRRQARIAARSAALAMLPAFRDASSSFTWTIQQLADGKPPDAIGRTPYNENISVGDLRDHHTQISALAPAMPQLGHDAIEVQHALRALQILDANLAGYAYGAWDDDSIYVGETWPASRKLIDETGAAIREALERLEAVAASRV
ncbi:hypothetical protein [Xanthomonas sp. XNM01]|uniref:hypothetical protein n=1 Tax=Xanthomonas sp. XNM01 TaxID=2769289 RepID=UPI001785F635|nr:hypothetical protein [Xanthomonas sp. XNM01]